MLPFEQMPFCGEDIEIRFVIALFVYELFSSQIQATNEKVHTNAKLIHIFFYYPGDNNFLVPITDIGYTELHFLYEL